MTKEPRPQPRPVTSEERALKTLISRFPQREFREYVASRDPVGARTSAQITFYNWLIDGDRAAQEAFDRFSALVPVSPSMLVAETFGGMMLGEERVLPLTPRTNLASIRVALSNWSAANGTRFATRVLRGVGSAKLHVTRLA